ncbi:MAG: hypothetical protein ABIO33_00685, partial [Leifsonia sp.]
DLRDRPVGRELSVLHHFDTRGVVTEMPNASGATPFCVGDAMARPAAGRRPPTAHRTENCPAALSRRA